MKRQLSVLVVWVLAVGTCFLSGEGAKLKGRLILQNSGGTPVPNAQVSSVGISSTVTDRSGYFEFKFSNRKPGDIIKLNVVKKGLEVVNKKDLDVIIKSDPNHIEQFVMCETGTRDKYARIYYEIAETVINKDYEEQLKKLEGDVKYRDKTIVRLMQERDAALSQAKEMANNFSRVNLDETSEMQKKAFELFKKGDINAARQILNDADLAKTNPEWPIKQHMSPMAYAIISAVSLIIGIGLLMLYTFKAKNLANQDINNTIFYFLLFPMGFSAAAFLFGAMRSYARYSGKQFSGYLELGGPVVLFLLVVVLARVS